MRKVYAMEAPMKLQKSKLCVNCESLYEQSTPCPYCGSEIFMWLSRALGTAIEEDFGDVDSCGNPLKETQAAQKLACRPGSAATAFGNTVMGAKSFAEFRLACGRVGREMVRVLTLGLVQACK